jgi:ankyrin repeat protein
MYIQNIADQVCEADIIDELAQMGDSLPEEYEKSISRIRACAPRCKLAMRTLSWLVSARTSLSANELCDALAINFEDSYLRVDRRPAFQTIIDACQGFVIMDETVATVELFHFTAKEFLVSLHDIRLLVESVIPQSPLMYLNYHNFKKPCTDKSELQERISRHPLCAYASAWWADHVRQGQHEGAARVAAFLASQNVFSSLQMLPTASVADPRLFGKALDYLGQPYPSGLFAAYLAVCFRLPKALESVLASNHNVSYSVPWGDNYAPLHAAMLLGDVEMANMLIQADTNMNLRDQFGLTPLHLALHLQSSSEGRLVELLCNAGADLSALDQDDDTPLHIAAGLAENSSVSLLLSRGADVNAQNKRGRIALHEAALREREDVIQTLLNHGADILRPDQEGITPLRLCLDTGRYSIVETLLGRALQGSLASPHPDIVAATSFLEPTWAHKASLENQEKTNLESYLSKEEYRGEQVSQSCRYGIGRFYYILIPPNSLDDVTSSSTL